MLKILLTMSCVKFVLAQNNVCSTFEDYKYIRSSKNCWRNPNVGANTMDILKQGYNYETHTVETEDGYILTVFRILPENSNNRVVYLQHGIYGDSSMFLLSGNISLAHRLVEKGYDVWLGNSRGSTYSKRHKNLNPKNKKFWDYSVHELGVYDIPPIMSHIETITKSQITYIGYSMGTTMSYIYSSTLVDHANKYLNAIISLAPVVKFDFYNSPLALLAPIEKYIKFSADLIKLYALNEHLEITKFVLKFCSTYPTILTCPALLAAAFGWTDKWSPSELPVIVSALNSGSVRLVQHYAQILKNHGRFAQFSYGKVGNLKKYDSKEPPLYCLKNVSLPIRLYYGSSDPFTTDKAIKALFDAVSSTDKRITRIPSSGSRQFNHIDYIFALDGNELLYKQLFDALDELYNT